METLITVLSVDENFVASIEQKLSPVVIALFLRNINDPMVNSIITDLIKILINNHQTNTKIEQRLVPTLLSILNMTHSPKNEEINEKKNFSTLLTVRIFKIYKIKIFFVNFKFQVNPKPHHIHSTKHKAISFIRSISRLFF